MARRADWLRVFGLATLLLAALSFALLYERTSLQVVECNTPFVVRTQIFRLREAPSAIQQALCGGAAATSSARAAAAAGIDDDRACGSWQTEYATLHASVLAGRKPARFAVVYGRHGLADCLVGVCSHAPDVGRGNLHNALRLCTYRSAP